MSLLDEKDLDELWDIYPTQYAAYNWILENSEIVGRSDSTLVLHSRLIQYTPEEREWMRKNNIDYEPAEMFAFWAFNVLSNDGFMKFRQVIKNVESGVLKDIYLITKPFTKREDIPEILHKWFIVTGWHDIKGKAYGFYTGRNR